MAWVIFGATFTLVHFGLCGFIVLRGVVLNRSVLQGEGVVSFGIFVLSGILASAESTVGYALVDLIVSTGRSGSVRSRRFSAIVGGALTYGLAWVVLALRLEIPKLSENVSWSILGLNINGEFPWGAIFLGGLVAFVAKSVGMVLALGTHTGSPR